jgi:hypothetical protein
LRRCRKSGSLWSAGVRRHRTEPSILSDRRKSGVCWKEGSLRPPTIDSRPTFSYREKYAEVREHLTERFGGLTAFSHSPAQGTTSDGGKTVHDEINRLRGHGGNSRRIVVEKLPASA